MRKQDLPIDGITPDIVASLERSNAVVIEAAPGAGKTTRVPVAIDVAGLTDGRMVVVLQPRRVAARAAARRIAWENGWRLGDEVGYHVRFDRKAGPATRILVVTEGIFISMLQRDPFLERVGAVVFDEFHERSLDLDISLAMSRRVQDQVRPDLRLIVMSATLDGGPVAAFLGDCPRVVCEVLQHPVEVTYAPRQMEGDPARAAAAAVKRALDLDTRDILVFLPGVAWIKRCARELESLSADRRFLLTPLHGGLRAEEQDLAIQPAEMRKVILATNIAETSVTIDGVGTVVDSGLARIMRYDRGCELNRLETSRISRASAKQRAGRAGRQGPGRCLRLWTEAEHSSLREAESPEISRLELSRSVLQLGSWGEHDLEAFGWFEKPPRRALEEAFELLRSLGAVNDAGLTSHGRLMAELPVSPRFARMLIEGHELGCLENAAWIAAALSEGLPAHADTLDLVAASLESTHRGHGQQKDARGRRIITVRDQLVEAVTRRLGPASKMTAGRREALSRAVLAAFPDRVARLREGAPDRAVMVGGRGLRLYNHGQAAKNDLFVAVEVTAGDRGRHHEARVSHMVPIERSWLAREFDETTTDHEIGPAGGKVRAIRRSTWRGLVLDEIEGPPNDPDRTAAVLAEAASEDLEANLGLDRRDVRSWLARLRSLAAWRPELGLPVFDHEEITAMLPVLSHGKTSIAELRKLPIVSILSGFLSAEQTAALEREAPERLRVPSGSRVRLDYEPGKPPVLAVRLQELFGMTETPTVAGGRVRVMLHLLAPNGRPQQITDDLASFWATTYQQVRAELRGRYPKHHWPEDPLKAAPTARTRPRRKRK
jgi:ATP-dependent helicase HrpB